MYVFVCVQIRACSTDAREKVQQVHQVSVDIEEAIVVAYADALASVRNVHGVHECYAFGTSGGCIKTETEEICASCLVHSVSYSEVIEIDAIAEASTYPVLRTRFQLLLRAFL